MTVVNYRVAGCMLCQLAQKSLCSLKHIPPSDSWQGDVLSSAARWQACMPVVLQTLGIALVLSISRWALIICCIQLIHRTVRKMRSYLPSTCLSVLLPGNISVHPKISLKGYGASIVFLLHYIWFNAHIKSFFFILQIF